jgi:hypothetical protein
VVYRAQEYFTLTFFSLNLFQLVVVTAIVDVPCRRSREQSFSIIYPLLTRSVCLPLPPLKYCEDSSNEVDYGKG